jgi:beta-lactamase class A
MIVDSDNGAKYTLLQHIDSKALLHTFSDLNIQVPNTPHYIISNRLYARFFKILYNATYLDVDMSEKAMELLNETKFNDGITAGVPSGIPVAHKFGQYTGPSEDVNVSSAWELDDCGVVYYPDKPYLLCVMTRGANLSSLAQVIRAVSEITYNEVDSNYQ